jgi:glutaredoxin
MPDIEYVKAFQERLERQTGAFAQQVRQLNPDAPVILIGKEGCAACLRLLTALEDKGVLVRKLSVTYDSEAKQMYEKLKASGQSVMFPITIIGDITVTGNRPDEIMRLLHVSTDDSMSQTTSTTHK